MGWKAGLLTRTGRFPWLLRLAAVKRMGRSAHRYDGAEGVYGGTTLAGRYRVGYPLSL
jgi:hypothetical protein